MGIEEGATHAAFAWPAIVREVRDLDRFGASTSTMGSSAMRVRCAESSLLISTATGPELACRWAKTRRSPPEATTDIGRSWGYLRWVACTIAMNDEPPETAKVRACFAVLFDPLRSVSHMRAWLPSILRSSFTTQTVFHKPVARSESSGAAACTRSRMKFPSVTISGLHTGHFLRAKMIHSIGEENTTFAWQ